MAVFPVTASDTGLSISESVSKATTSKPTDTGLTVTTSAQRALGRFATDTGLSQSGQIAMGVSRRITDTGATVTDTPTRGRPSDQGMYATFPVTPLQVLQPATNVENPLSSNGNFVLGPGTYATNLWWNFGTIAATNFFQIGQQTYIGAGLLTDCEGYISLASAGNTSGFVMGLVFRQDPGSPAGTNCYAAVFKYTSGFVNGNIEIHRINATGGVTVLGSVPITFTSGFGSKIGFRAVGSTLTAYYQNSLLGSQWIKALEVHDSTYQSGYLGIRMNAGGMGFQGNTFGGGALTDRLTPDPIRPLADTGLTVTGDVISFRANVPPDTGLTLTEHITPRNIRTPSDTGLTITDHIGRFGLSDTGLSVSDSVHAQRVVPRNPTDTLTFSDSTKKTAKHFIADTGLTITTTVVTTKNGSNPSVNITDIGLGVTTSLAKVGHYFRTTVFPSADTGLSITAGIKVTRTPPFKPKKPQADFNYSGGSLSVHFTDESDPGSAPIDSWDWTFGDGGTSSATNPTHVYSASGTYNVGLTVTTIYGVSHVTKPINVTSGVTPAGIHLDAVIV